MTISEALEVLEVQKGFTKTELSKAYRHALMVWHPDRFSGNDELLKKAHERTRKIIEAFDLLAPLATSEAELEAAGKSGNDTAARKGGLKPKPRPIATVPKPRDASRLTPAKKSESEKTSWIIAGVSLLLVGMVFAVLSFWPKTPQVPSTGATPAEKPVSRETTATVATSASVIERKMGNAASDATAHPQSVPEVETMSADDEVKLGRMYLNGAGVPKDEVEAAKWFRKAAERGSPAGQVFLGSAYSDGIGVTKDQAKAAKWFRKSAEGNDAFGQYLLGRAYASGTGVSKDDAEAVKWYRLAAEQNMAEAQNDLGRMYAKGIGIPKDEAEAAKWYRLAAEKNLPEAQYNLGMLYFDGKIGVIPRTINFGSGVSTVVHDPDFVQAHIWLNLAGANGREDARNEIALIEIQMQPEQKVEAAEKAKELFAKIKSAEKK